MKNKAKSGLLRLDEYEKKTSRFLLLWISPEEARGVAENQCFSFSREPSDRNLWEQLLDTDLVVCLAFDGDHINRYAYQVVGKGIKLSDPSFFSDMRPYVTLLRQVGFGKRSTVKGAAFFYNEFPPYAPRPIFQELWEECSSIEVLGQPNSTDLFCLSRGDFQIRIASSHEDYSYVASVAAHHAFGPKKSVLTLIAETGGFPVGAILVEPDADSRRYHRAAIRLFRSDYPWIRRQAVHIARIYSSDAVSNKWRLHKALLKSAIAIAPSLVSGPISIVQGISYDYHPVAIELGFHVEVPSRIEGSFYYWKDVNLPPRLSSNAFTFGNDSKSIHSLLRARKNIHYWLAPGSLRNIRLGIEKAAWAIQHHPPNSGRWRQVAPGHVVFLISEDKRIRAYGNVIRTANQKLKGYERYPLWIEFYTDIVHDLDIDISEHLSERWFAKLDRGGLIPLPEEFGARLKRLSDESRTEGRMWVEPNPYLLHQTDFQTIKGQVFIVQSWSLREKVLPVIREILSTSGYTVKYSGDREGQVLFEIVWQLLNESEVVLVDFTDKRPNVYLEYGMALVLGKPIIAVTQDQADIPSDTPNLKYIVYQNVLGDTALTKLPKAISETISDIEHLKDKKTLRL